MPRISTIDTPGTFGMVGRRIPKYEFMERDGMKIFTRNPCTPQEELYCICTEVASGKTREVTISRPELRQCMGLNAQANACRISDIFSEKLKAAFAV